MEKAKFRKPREIKESSDPERKPLSSRVKVTTHEELESLANNEDISLSELVAGILDDYVAWARKGGRGGGR